MTNIHAFFAIGIFFSTKCQFLPDEFTIILIFAVIKFDSRLTTLLCKQDE